MLLKMSVIIVICLAFVVPSLAFHENEGTAYLGTLCAITENFTANCDEKWIMVYLPDMTFVQEPVTEDWPAGYAIHLWKEDGQTYSICNTFPEVREFGDGFCSSKWFVIGNIKLDSCWNDKCLPLIWHELKHLICECNWHDGMTNKNGFVDLPENDV